MSVFGVVDGRNEYGNGTVIGESGAGVDAGVGATGYVGLRGGSGKGGIDGITVRNLENFWDVVRRKFKGLEEIWIVGMGMEGRVLDWGTNGYEYEEGLGRVLEESDFVGEDGDGDGMMRKRRTNFGAKNERAVSRLEEETG